MAHFPHYLNKLQSLYLNRKSALSGFQSASELARAPEKASMPKSYLEMWGLKGEKDQHGQFLRFSGDFYWERTLVLPFQSFPSPQIPPCILLLNSVSLLEVHTDTIHTYVKALKDIQNLRGKKPGLMVQACHPSCWRQRQGNLVQGQSGQLRQKTEYGSVMQHSPSMCEVQFWVP